MDVMSGVMLDDGTDLRVVTGIDDHSRFCVAAGLVRRATSRAVCEVFRARQRKMAHLDFLELVLADEVTRRDALSATLQAQRARLDPTMTLRRGTTPPR
jgi:hypothetical protein